jgi:hypothetical protein
MTGSIKPWGTPEIQPLLIRDHFGLIHLLAEPYAGRGRCEISFTRCYRKKSEKNWSGAGGAKIMPVPITQSKARRSMQSRAYGGLALGGSHNDERC